VKLHSTFASSPEGALRAFLVGADYQNAVGAEKIHTKKRLRDYFFSSIFKFNIYFARRSSKLMIPCRPG